MHAGQEVVMHVEVDSLSGASPLATGARSKA